MNERERPIDDRRLPDGSGGNPFGADLGAVGEEARRLLHAGRAAIDHALSGNSEDWLGAKRQTGGQ
jgi:hypothetical protein